MANYTHGFVTLSHLSDQRVTTVGVDTIIEAVAESARLHTQFTQEVLNALVTRTTKWQYNYRQPVSGTLQPADPDAVPVPTKTGAAYTLSHPIQGGMTAWGGNHVALAHMTVQDAYENTLMLLQQDQDWMRRHLFAALYNDDSYTFKDEMNGDLTVLPLANNDSVTYLKKTGETGTANHFLAQANAVGNNDNPFPTIFSTLDQWVGNTGYKVAYIPTNLKTAVMALTNFYDVSDPALVRGVSSDYLNSVPADIPTFGGKVIGYCDEVYIVHLSTLPSSYIWAFDTAQRGFMAMREFEPAELQGFYTTGAHDIDGNHLRYGFYRWAGFSPRNRVAALVYRIGNGTYAPPTFAATMPLSL